MITINTTHILLLALIGFVVFLLYKSRTNILNNLDNTNLNNSNDEPQFGKHIIDGFVEYLEDYKKCKKPTFQPYKWNVDGIQRYNNCYAYAFRAISDDYTSKPQPGDYAGLDTVNYDDYFCKNFSDLIQRDYPDVLISSEKGECPCGYYKIALFMDDSPPYKDYHFYRQDADGTWSHKPGGTKAIRADDSGNIIHNPVDADRYYEKSSKKYNYEKNCGFFCYPYKENEILDG